MACIHTAAAGMSSTHDHEVYRFRAYQLLFVASFPIPEMVAADRVDSDRERAPDVLIRTDDFPDNLPDPLETSHVHEVNGEALLLRVADVARYLIREGREILIDREPHATDHDVRVYLLGTCIGALLHQRGLLVLHASGVMTDRGCLLFTGESGTGKSTLLAEFLRRGHKMVVDDVCALRFDSADRPIVLPSYPRTRLWADAADRFAIDTSRLERTRPSWDKFERQISEQFWDHAEPVSHVFHLTAPGASDQVTLQRLEPTEAFSTLVDNTYRGVLLDGMDLRSSHFDLASRAARSIDVIRVMRPANSDTVEEMATRILASVR